MNETQADRIITDIQNISEILKALQDKDVELSDAQKEELKNLPANKREEKAKEFMKAKEEEKLQRRMLLLRELEDKIKASGLPLATQHELLAVLQQAKDNNWKFSPEALEKMEKIKQEENTKKEQEELKRLEKEQAETSKTSNVFADTAAVVTGVAVGATVAAVTAPVVATALVMDTPIAFTENAKRPSEEIVIEKAPEKVANVAKKAVMAVAAALDKPEKDVTLDDIQRSDKLLNVQKRYARAQHIKQNPALAKDLKHQQEVAVQTAEEKSNRRYAVKQAKKAGKPVPEEYKNYRQNNRPNYTPEEWALVKQVNKIKQKGKALTFDEVKKELPAEQAVAYEKFMRAHHPELFVNQNREVARLALKARLEARKQQYRIQKMAENIASMPARAETEKPRVNLQQMVKEGQQNAKTRETLVRAAVPQIEVNAKMPQKHDKNKEHLKRVADEKERKFAYTIRQMRQMAGAIKKRIANMR